MSVLILEPLEADVVQWLGERHDARFAPELVGDFEGLVAALQDARALVAPPEAVLSALLAVGVVAAMFNEYGVPGLGSGGVERQLIATVDLRLGTPALAAERGAAQARIDVEAGILKLQTVGPPPTKAETSRAERMKQRYGVVWVNKSEKVTPASSAFVDAYNRVMHAEIERRHGKHVADGLMGFDEARRRAGSEGAP